MSCCCRSRHCGGDGCCKSSQSLTWSRFRAKLPSKLLLKVYIVTFLDLFSSSYAITMLFPFLPFMMEFLIPKLRNDQKSVGKYVGLVSGSLFFGRVFGSYLWGVMADRIGRKPVMIISLLCVAVFTLAFGFSVNFAMAILTRFFVGFLNGIVATSRAVMSEVSDDSNQAFGFTLLGTAWGSGYIIGPAISGVLADPIGQYNLTITNPVLHGYLSRFPYSLPAVFNFFLFVITLIATLFLPETRNMKKNRKRSELDREGRSRTGINSTARGRELVAAEDIALLNPTVKKHYKTSKFLSTLKNLFMDLKLFFCNRASLISLVVYSLYAVADVGFNELFSLWAYTQPHLGGLGLSLRQIGIVLTIVGVLLLPVNPLAFPLLEKRLHSIKSFYLIGISLTFLLTLFPTIHYLVSAGHSWLFWGVLVVATFLINASFTIGFSAIFMFINNSVTFDKLGSINGISMTMASLTRAFSPMFFGNVFSASLSEATLEFGFPVDYNLAFVLLSLIILACVLMVTCLPLSINHQKIIEDV